MTKNFDGTAEALTFSSAADNTTLALVCGPLDENLREMSSVLNVEIRRRGSTFRVAGEKTAAERAVRAIRGLIEETERSAQL